MSHSKISGTWLHKFVYFICFLAVTPIITLILKKWLVQELSMLNKISKTLIKVFCLQSVFFKNNVNYTRFKWIYCILACSARIQNLSHWGRHFEHTSVPGWISKVTNLCSSSFVSKGKEGHVGNWFGLGWNKGYCVYWICIVNCLHLPTVSSTFVFMWSAHGSWKYFVCIVLRYYQEKLFSITSSFTGWFYYMSAESTALSTG